MGTEARRRLPRRTVFCLAVMAALGMARVAHADGEAGLVVDYGDGRVETFCVGFTGDSIDGATLLARAGLGPGDAGGLVCSIGGTGCPAHDCLCQCENPGGECTYWAFFTQEYAGGWVYSPAGYRIQRSGDGDVQGWRWGEGGPNSAPAPAAVTFEGICGHTPQGGAPAATATEGPTAGASALPPPATAAQPGEFTAAPSGDLTISPTALREASRTPGVTAVIVGAGTNAPPRPTTTDTDGGGEDGRGLVAFGVVAGALGLAIAGALARKGARRER